ncbi:hypothetical protein LXL04_000640 [Taraxacum kok-saghyz]
MDEGGPSDDYDLDSSYRGPNYDSNFEESEFEGDESDESSDSGFVVDLDLDDSDVEANGVGVDTAELERESDDEVEPIEYCMHDPSVDRKKMKPHLGERFANQEQLRFCLTNHPVKLLIVKERKKIIDLGQMLYLSTVVCHVGLHMAATSHF